MSRKIYDQSIYHICIHCMTDVNCRKIYRINVKGILADFRGGYFRLVVIKYKATLHLSSRGSKLYS